MASKLERSSRAQYVALAEIVESTTNPRRIFDKAALEELTESVRRHGVLQPILVRPIPPESKNGIAYEVVAGARRFRAAQAAGLEEIPAVVRQLTDRETLEIQVIENLQREDLHPLEEAEGYRRLQKDFGLEVDELAAKVGKSKGYVYARLKLCALPPKAQKLFLAGELDASRALLVARIPVEDLAEEAAKEIAAMTYRDAAEHVQHHYMLQLKKAPFPTGDAELVPAAGACGPCPKRTGNQGELFGDVRSADVCTDPKCYAAKIEAWWQREKAKAEFDGRKVLEGNEARNARYSSQYVQLNDCCYDDPKHRTWGKLLRGTDTPVILARMPHFDEVIKLAPRKEAVKALKETGHKFAQERRPDGSRDPYAKEKDAHRRRCAAIAAALPDLVAKAEFFQDPPVFMRFLVEDHMFQGHHDATKAVCKRRGWDPVKGQASHFHKCAWKELDGLTAGELRGILVELIAVDGASSQWQTGYGPRWLAACQLLGIDMKAYEHAAPAKVQKKAPAKAKATKKRKGAWGAALGGRKAR